MCRKALFSILPLVLAAVAPLVASAQNPYGGAYGNPYQRRIPTFGAGSYQTPPPTGNYRGNSLGSAQQPTQTYPPAPRVRRPVISPYLNLNRPEGVVSGVPNYYSLVRPRVEAFDRYKQGVDDFQRFKQDNARQQQELYEQQQRDYEALNERIRQDQAANQAAGSRPLRTQYTRPPMRATGHATSFGVR